ncbi:ABC transporter ATP-binding protein [Aquabacter sp. L1I39]|uniref:ABC transporter ATP-binding protein n=1 Tax=Aquabacter sp. L1I39 TaxID=2820278 RepID=UPI001ADA58D5|nr:ABC transporter ATP-binding protein [Aquabacter sp. L1I39]QTL04165.1 ABC transporter ATP-binding protein [Aquabacter sp. L1I39]
MSDVVLQSVVKRYEAMVAVDHVSLAIKEGELVALLGPSGCGKTTTLRMIGGFIPVTEGRILVGGRDVTALPPFKRNMGFGFQNYALFPHMSVAENVAFGLEMRKVAKAEREARVKAALDRVRLGHLAARLPKQLSGGQQQRVALARALVIEPDVLLLDEPLSNLDAQLRAEMKDEIREIQRSLGITTIFVTHDQDEALSVADRVVVMQAGRIEQDGTPDTVFETPRSHFVAQFMGVTNLFKGETTADGRFRLGGGEVIAVPPPPVPGAALAFALRPERIALDSVAGEASEAANRLDVEIEAATYRGLVIDYRLKTATGLTLIARQPAPAVGGPPALQKGQRVTAHWQAQAGVLVPV